MINALSYNVLEKKTKYKKKQQQQRKTRILDDNSKLIKETPSALV